MRNIAGGDFSKLADYFVNLARGMDSRLLFRNVAVYLHKIVFEAFDKSGARAGHPRWQDLSIETIKARIRKRQNRYTGIRHKKKGNKKVIDWTRTTIQYQKERFPILRDTGRLRNSFRVINQSAKSLVFGSTLEYAPKHQYGDKHIPKREMLFWTRQDDRRLEGYIEKWIKEVFTKNE